MKLEEIRKNVHQLHFEDLVLLGQEGFDELNRKIDAFKNKLQKGDDSDINTTVKIDGCLAPETIIKTTEGDISFSKLITDYNTLGKVYIGFGKDDKTNTIKEVELSMPRVINGNKEWCTVEFDNNSCITCTCDHPFKDGDDYTEACKLDNHSKIDVI